MNELPLAGGMMDAISPKDFEDFEVLLDRSRWVVMDAVDLELLSLLHDAVHEVADRISV